MGIGGGPARQTHTVGPKSSWRRWGAGTRSPTVGLRHQRRGQPVHPNAGCRGPERHLRLPSRQRTGLCPHRPQPAERRPLPVRIEPQRFDLSLPGLPTGPTAFPRLAPTAGTSDGIVSQHVWSTSRGFAAPSGGVKGGGKVGHVGGLIVDSPSPSGTFCRHP